MSEGVTFSTVQTEGPTERMVPLFDPALKDRVFSRGDIRETDLLIFVREKLLDKVLSHICAHRSREVGGVLVGGYHTYNTMRFIEVRGFIRAEHTVSRTLSLTFTHETWEAIHQKKKELYPDERVLGWYHSHPRSGIYFSGNDVFIHQNFFSLEWQVALVVDPQKRDFGFFQWNGESVERRGYYFISDSLAIG